MIGILNAYRLSADAPPYQMEYAPMLLAYLKRVWPTGEFRVYDVALGIRPKDIAECSGWLITGSSRGAYDPDPWIAHVTQFIQECHLQQKKMVGICFGHQLIAQALGGKTEKSASGWGVGVRSISIVESAPWMSSQREKISLIFSHQDQVVRLPSGARHLAKSDYCPIQMYSIGAHIFCLQGHPEFTPNFARQRYDTRIALIGRDQYQAAITSLDQSTDSDLVGSWIVNFYK